MGWLRAAWAVCLVAVVVPAVVRPGGDDRGEWVFWAALALAALAVALLVADVGSGLVRWARREIERARHASGERSWSSFSSPQERDEVLGAIASGEPSADPVRRALETRFAQGLVDEPEPRWGTIALQLAAGLLLLGSGHLVLGGIGLAAAVITLALATLRSRRRRQALVYLDHG